MRIKLNEITPTRVVQAIERRIKNIPHSNEWLYSQIGKNNQQLLRQYHNKHKGKRCFIIANGPSLATMDLSPLKNEITFGMNRLYLIFDKIGFVPTYYSVINELVIQQFAKDLEALPTTLFLNWTERGLFANNSSSVNYLRNYYDLEDKFSRDITQGIYSGGTVTYATLQVAYYMGFSEVYIIGMDHNFADKGRPNATEVRKDAEDKNHFHPDYFPKGMKWQLPDLYRSELAYAQARQSFEKEGRKVIDATVNGKCTIFEKGSFTDLFR
ncbi:6-hydroxymethylpterin diphosphokinase MptE-like protein [Larkinella sp. VNQ87]|uniref:6-hydroxymethylpterin diphosphokinase MptE-like protein n=1 Tax=Larkinella sp. VNQ87 TaxID=3400921 RepID=UPI003BFC6CDA